MAEVLWLELEGSANTRDVGGLPTGDGRLTRPGRLIRSDNLQGLSDRDVEEMVERHDVRRVADLRTEVEVRSEGPGPLESVDGVEIRHLSLMPASSDDTGPLDPDRPVVLPWQDPDFRAAERRRGAFAVYGRYLEDRADSVLAALRFIATSPGATVVHCAAGKDRTGVVVAFALAEVGVTRDAIVADYARSAERIEKIFARLRATHTYENDLQGVEAKQQAPSPMTMDKLLAEVDERHGGVASWLRAHGWTDADAAALRAKLLDP